jgi:hypothetical protein
MVNGTDGGCNSEHSILQLAYSYTSQEGESALMTDSRGAKSVFGSKMERGWVTRVLAVTVSVVGTGRPPGYSGPIWI